MRSVVEYTQIDLGGGTMAILLLLIGIILFIAAYATYGSWLAKKWGIDPSKPTPAHTMKDGVDYDPTHPRVLLGHHFSSIAGVQAR